MLFMIVLTNGYTLLMSVMFSENFYLSGNSIVFGPIGFSVLYAVVRCNINKIVRFLNQL